MAKKEGNWFARHKILTGVMALVLVGIIAAAASSSDEATNQKSDSSQNDTNAKDSDSKTEYVVGDTIKLDDRDVIVTKVKRNYSTGNQFAKPESGNEFVLVTIKVKNTSDSSIDYNSYNFKLQDSEGVQKDEDISVLSEGQLNSGSLATGGKVSGKIGFQVKKGDKKLALLYSEPSLFSDKSITIKL